MLQQLQKYIDTNVHKKPAINVNGRKLQQLFFCSLNMQKKNAKKLKIWENCHLTQILLLQKSQYFNIGMIPMKGLQVIKSPDNKMKILAIFPMLAIVNRNDLQVVTMKVAKQTTLAVINVHNTNFKDKKKLVKELNVSSENQKLLCYLRLIEQVLKFCSKISLIDTAKIQ